MIAIMTMLMACGEKNQDTASEPLVSEEEVSPFANQRFTLVESETEGFRLVSEVINLSTDEDFGFGFSGDCNSFSGSYSLDNDVFIAATLSGTEMGCDSSLMEEETLLVEFFMNNPTWNLNNDMLVFSNSTTTLTFTSNPIEVPRVPFLDTTWYVNSFIDGDAVSTINLTNIPSIIFSSGGEVSIDTGCNQGVGTFQQNETTIGIGIENYSEAVCPDSSSQDAERLIVNIFMTEELEYSMNGNQLTLMNNSIGIIASSEQ